MRFMCDSKSFAKSFTTTHQQHQQPRHRWRPFRRCCDSQILFVWIFCVSMSKTTLSRPDAHLNRSLRMKAIRKFFIMSISINSMEFKTTHYLMFLYSANLSFCCIQRRTDTGHTAQQKDDENKKKKIRIHFFFPLLSDSFRFYAVPSNASSFVCRKKKRK